MGEEIHGVNIFNRNGLVKDSDAQYVATGCNLQKRTATMKNEALETFEVPVCSFKDVNGGATDYSLKNKNSPL